MLNELGIQMKILFSIFFVCLLSVAHNAKQYNFSDYFKDAAMRIDYFHIGNAAEEFFTIDKVYKYSVWGRSKINLIDDFNNGRYYLKIYDVDSGELIYSKGFDSYFGEYQTSLPAIQGIRKTFHESAIIPFPIKPVKFVIEKRNLDKELNEIYSTVINPAEVSIISAKTNDENVEVFESYKSGDPGKRVDIVILGEGYTNKEKNKFKSDIERFTEIFFSQEPYKSYKESFNIYGVLKPSAESGVDEPRANSFKETTLNATFNSLGSERYLLTEDNKTMRDLAAYITYDAIYIMVNHSRYGGGGIYNLYCTFTSDAQYYKYLFIHEFGHSFTGLADEYYTSSTSYNEFYPSGVEPVEPNITALLDPPNVKWSHLLSKGIEIPTPWEKSEFDAMDSIWQLERAKLNDNIARLKRDGESKETISRAEKEYAKKDKNHSEKIDSYLRAGKFWNKVGAYEGAGYSSKGLYRPMPDCIMFSKGDKPFCKVCEEAIIKVIKFYSE